MAQRWEIKSAKWWNRKWGKEKGCMLMPEANAMKLWVQSGTKMGDKECKVARRRERKSAKWNRNEWELRQAVLFNSEWRCTHNLGAITHGPAALIKLTHSCTCCNNAGPAVLVDLEHSCTWCNNARTCCTYKTHTLMHLCNNAPAALKKLTHSCTWCNNAWTCCTYKTHTLVHLLQ